MKTYEEIFGRASRGEALYTVLKCMYSYSEAQAGKINHTASPHVSVMDDKQMHDIARLLKMDPEHFQASDITRAINAISKESGINLSWLHQKMGTSPLEWDLRQVPQEQGLLFSGLVRMLKEEAAKV